jgi:hypothetical protein
MAFSLHHLRFCGMVLKHSQMYSLYNTERLPTLKQEGHLSVQMYLGFHVKVPDFNQIWICLADFHKSQISRKIYPVEAELIRADRWMDRHNEANRHFL